MTNVKKDNLHLYVKTFFNIYWREKALCGETFSRPVRSINRNSKEVGIINPRSVGAQAEESSVGSDAGLIVKSNASGSMTRKRLLCHADFSATSNTGRRTTGATMFIA